MTPAEFAKKVRANTKQSTTTLSDADIISIADPIKNDLASLIAQNDIKGNYFILPFEGTADNTREINFGALNGSTTPNLGTLLNQFYSVEISIDSGATYQRALPDTYTKFGVARTEANITARYSNAHPRYEIQRQSIFILSGTLPSSWLYRVRMRVFPYDLSHLDDLTATDFDLAEDDGFESDSVDNGYGPTVFGMPIQFHRLWAIRTSIEWKSQHPGAVPPTADEQRYDTDLALALSGIRDNDLTGETIAQIPFQDEHNSIGYDL